MAGIDDPERKRARHIVTENQRVLDGLAALKAGDAARFGYLIVGSHASQRDDYAVSVAEVDILVEAALDLGAAGARLTSGGFGGFIVALVKTEETKAWCRSIADRFPQTRLLALT